MNALERFDQSEAKQKSPAFQIGDTVRVHLRVLEGEKERMQVFEGVVIARKGPRTRETFTVRKVSYGVGVERVLSLHSPMIARLEVGRGGRVNRAKLYYLRQRKGRSARLGETSEAEAGITVGPTPPASIKAG